MEVLRTRGASVPASGPKRRKRSLQEEFEYYLETTGVSEKHKQKTALLLHLLGEDSLKIFEGFELDEEHSLDVVQEEFVNFGTPKDNFLDARFGNKRSRRSYQTQEEQFPAFFHKLQKLATSADDLRDSAICDQILSSIRDEIIKERIIWDNNRIKEKIHSICEQLVLSQETLNEVCSHLQEELNRGLSKETNAESTVKCFPTYVKELPNGKEKGRFLALDLGGTNFRVLLIELGKNKFHMDGKIFAVPQDIMMGPGEGLFDHIASCLATFVQDRELQDEILPLGFTFSFPCQQEGLTKARLATWTKGFRCAGVEGEDVVRLLQEAIERRGDVKILICAILNDTTGTLMSCAWKNRNCRIGLIVGTGSNACYMEKLEKVELWDGDDGEPRQDVANDVKGVIVNTEWGAFGDNGCLSMVRTDYDDIIDKESLNPGKQLYEKMISGMYMGEIVRQVLVHLTNEGLLFGGNGSEMLFEKGAFYTKYVSEIESEEQGDVNKCRDILEELELDHATDADCLNVRHVCECVSRRAAALSGAGVAVLLNRIQEESVTVAVDGSVYRFHPHFHNLMVETISSLINPGMKFDLMLSEDGSGRGAALVAAVASRIAEENKNNAR